MYVFAALDGTFLGFGDLGCYIKLILDSQKGRDFCTHRGQPIEKQVEGRR